MDKCKGAALTEGGNADELYSGDFYADRGIDP